MLNVIKECRKLVASNADGSMRHSTVANLLDNIEAEIAEKYMELPLDADGVSIKVGDMIQFVNEYGGTGSKVEVCAVSNYYAYYGEGKHFYNVKYCRHVSLTLEDVLEDFIKTYDRWDEKGIDEDERTALFSEYATEIRDLLGVSDDSR